MTSTTPSLTEIAHQAMLDRGLLPDFPPGVLKEVAAIPAPATPIALPAFRDLRQFLWISIDNDDSKDLDQLTFFEKNSLEGHSKIYVAIADVDALVKPNSAIDNYAAHNTTSVYTPTKIFPMLPPRLSTDLTSLNEHTDRCAIVVEMDIDPTGNTRRADIYPAWVHNHAKLAYNGVAAFLEKQAALPNPQGGVQGVAEQLREQDIVAQRIREQRERQGALEFATLETRPVMANGKPIGIEPVVHNRAHELIENFMIAANVAFTRFLSERKQLTLRRSVRTPERWDRIVALARKLGSKLPPQPDGKALQAFLIEQQKSNPEGFPDLSLAIIKLIGRGEYIAGIPGEIPPGHFDLALQQYAHTTAPNRRYPDLIMQRILKSLLYQTNPPYRKDQLESLAQQCTQREDDATKVERRVRKSAAAAVVSDQIGKQFSAIVTGASDKGTWVRTFNPPLEGKLVEGFRGVDVGDRITVKLIHVDVVKGFIDFGRQ